MEPDLLEEAAILIGAAVQEDYVSFDLGDRMDHWLHRYRTETGNDI